MEETRAFRFKETDSLFINLVDFNSKDYYYFVFLLNPHITT